MECQLNTKLYNSQYPCRNAATCDDKLNIRSIVIQSVRAVAAGDAPNIFSGTMVRFGQNKGKN